MYPYLYGYEPLVLFRGEDYGTAYPLIWTPGVGWDLFQEVGKFVGNVTKEAEKAVKTVVNVVPGGNEVAGFVGNVVQTAGHAVGDVTKTIQNVAGQVSKEAVNIPLIGGLIQGVFDVAYNVTFAPLNVVVAIAVDGKRIDQVVLNQLKDALKGFKEVAPYAQMVVSIVPGVGPLASAGLSAGLALVEGQPIKDVLKAGLIGAMPGGPLVKAAVTMATELIQVAATGGKLDFATLAKTAGGIASSTLGLPIAATHALTSGLTVLGDVASGKPFEKALVDTAIRELPVDQKIRTAISEASNVAGDIVAGKPVNDVVFNRVNRVINELPGGNALKQTLQTGITAVKRVAEGKKTPEVLLGALQTGLADTLIQTGGSRLPSDAQKAIRSGVALGTGVIGQVKRGEQLVKKVPGKLIESGIQLAKAHPMFNAARDIAKKQGGARGFDLASGLTQHQIGVFDVATSRNNLPSAADKLGFDLACACNVGAVANPKPANLSASAVAGHMITMGMQGYTSSKKQVLMQSVSSSPKAAAGATNAVKIIAAARASKFSTGSFFR